MLYSPPKLAKVSRPFLFAFVLSFFTLAFFTPEKAHAQASTEFWIAPPQVTYGHGLGGDSDLIGGSPIWIRLSSGDEAADVTISQPANPGFNGGSPITVSLAPNSSTSINMTSYTADIVTDPANTVLNTGLKISSTTEITALYEISTPNNPDIWALKGETGLGQEFYVPFQNIWRNGGYTPAAYTSFDIVATEDNTTVLIFPTSDLDGGQNAFQSFTITLNEGQTYSASVTDANNPQNNPTGSIVISDKDIAISIKDDSVQPTGAGCRDVQGDQIVPVEIIGNEYIVIRGGLNTTINEWAFAVAIANNTQISVNGDLEGPPLFAGQTLPIEITNADQRTYITGNKDFYLVHVSGFGCESGIALLPPLACAGSEQVSFTRSTNESFFLNILVPSGAEDAFELNGDPNAIVAGDFDPVPGTGGNWLGARIQFTTGQIPSGQANLLTNSEEPFALGLINGGGSSGCRYGYFSEFSAPIVVDAGPEQNVCANRTTQLNGSVSGGATQGVWSSDGTGAFVPDANTLDAIYEPSLADLSAGSVTLTLTSVSNCFPVSDEVTINYNPAPIVDAGDPIEACENNTSAQLDGFVDIATGGLWSGGSGSFSPSPAILGAIYNPTPEEVEAGSLWLYLTTTGNGNCFAEVDSVEITWVEAPTVDAGENQTVCANNPAVSLSGSVDGAGGGQWSGGAGLFSPSNQALGATYTPNEVEIQNGFVTLTLTSTDNGGCSPVSDEMTIFFDPAPVVNAGSDQDICRNNANIQLNGSVSNAGGGVWSGGSGTFDPSPEALNAVYTPTPGELLLGGITLTLTSTGNGDCLPVNDQVTINFTEPPIVNAGADANICENNAQISLNGSLSGANFGLWDGGLGTFTPNTTSLTATYTPTNDELESGSVTLTLTSLDNGNCNPVVDEVTFTFTPAPTADAGEDISACSNNPVVQLAGSISVAGGAEWSGGNGSFSPDNTVLAANYTPTAAEIANGSVTLTLTTTSNGNCSPVSDEVLVTFTESPTVNAGSDLVLCANNAEVPLDGAVTVAGGGQWTGGLGSFSNGSTGLENTYTPTTTEINSGSLTLTLTSTDNGNCLPVSDEINITFTPAPVVDAGAPISVCSNNAQVTLSGTVDIAGGGTWSGGDGSFFPNANNLNALYTPTPAEISAGSLILTLTTTGNGNCLPEEDFVSITFTPAPTANAGADVSVCANNPQVNLNGNISVAGGAVWSGGSGTFDPNNTSLGATYTPSPAEISVGSTTLTLTTTDNANCNAVSDEMTITITPPPLVDAGAGGVLCANNATISLEGSVSVATGGSWSGGNGTFDPSSNDLNATYTPSQGEINSGSLTLTLTSTGNGNCIAVSDEVTYTFSPAPTADAGAAQSLCGNNAEAQLSGAVTVATGGTWSGGDGNFSPSANDLNAFYTPTPEEISDGSVTLTLTTTGNGDCLPVSDEVTLTYTPAPTANAGADRVRCANNPEVELNGSVTVATGGTWSGGNGSFDPDANTLAATYTPSAGELAAGSVTLTLTTTGNANCNPVSDQMTITYTPEPEVDAGAGGVLCANNATISLEGSVSVATGGSWSGGNGTFDPSSNDLNATYTPSQGEINSGSLTLTLTSTGNGNCIAVSDEVTYTFSTATTADAGENQTLCANNAEAQLNAAVTVATGGTWSGGSGNFSPNANDLNAIYTPTPEEISDGSVTLTLTTTGNGDCLPASDQVSLNFTNAPTANAGSDVFVCANNVDVNLNGSVTIATGGEWSGGSGSFNPDANALNAVYTPSQGEIDAGVATLTLTTTGNGNCNPVSDEMTINIIEFPMVDAGSDFNICENNNVFTLSGSVQNAGGGQWSGGSGIYDPSPTSLEVSYTPTLAEMVAGSITFTLTSTDIGSCIPVTDEVTVTFTPAPIVDAGESQTLCAATPNAQLEGSFDIAGGAQWSGGEGSFSPNSLNMNAVYTPTSAEIADGSVTLVLTSTDNGNCLPVSDEVEINFTPVPTVNAGSSLISCANNPNVNLQGSFSNAEGIVWSGGTGFFDPSSSTANAVYTPSNTEIINGGTTLTITTTGTGACPPVSDEVNILINPAPVVDAGSNISVCSNNPLVTLNGSVEFAGGGQWSGGEGNFSPSANALSVNYEPTLNEILSGSLTLTLTSTGNQTCNPVSDQVTITFTPSPIADAGSNQTVCANNPEVQLNGSFSVSEGAIWSGGAGSFNPGSNSMNAVYTPSQGEISNGSVTLTLTTIGNGNCLAVSDQMSISITPPPVVDAGEDIFACVDALTIPLSGSVSGPTSSGVWSTSGTGTFVPNPFNLNASYIASSLDSIAGEVTITLSSTNNGNCIPETDDLTIFISPAGTADVGPDIVVCANNTEAALEASIGGAASSGTWTSSGTGSFEPSSDITNPTYVPSAEDVDAGSVTLTFMVNSCNQAFDQLELTITPAPIVDAGGDLVACAADGQIDLNGSVGGVNNEGEWTSSGTGFFAPSATSLDATYIFSEDDIAAQGVELSLTSINIGNCIPVSETINLDIFPEGNVEVGADVSVCANNAEVDLVASISGADQGVWSSTGTGSFTPSASSLEAVYVPSPADADAGSVVLTFTATNSCNPAEDFLTVSIGPSPIVDAGEDQAVCGEVVPFQISGNVSNAGGGQWTTSGSGTFQNATNLNTFYVASQDDIDMGSVTLTLTSTGNGNCLPESNSIQLDISTGIEVEVGPDREVCSELSQVQLFASVSNGTTTGVWSSSGSGSFSPSAEALNAVYQFTQDDVDAGSVTITLTSTNNGICEEVSESFELSFGNTAFVYAGEDQEACVTTELISISGLVDGETTTGVWSSSGDGTFFPTSSSLNASYEPGPNDIANGNVVLTLTSTNSTLCSEGSDNLTINFQALPVANAGEDVLLCGALSPIQLLGSVQGASGGVWTTNGSGEFVPSADVLTASYIPSTTDSLIGSVQLTLSTTGNGLCEGSSDVMEISFSDATIPNAGSNQMVCETVSAVELNGSISGSGNVFAWSSSGSGSFVPGTGVLNTSYIPSMDDIMAGSVTLYLEAESEGNCPGQTDSITVSIDRQPIIETSSSIASCTIDQNVSLTANVSFQDAVLWESASGGSFVPGPNQINVSYVPSSGEQDAGISQLTLTALNSGACGNVSTNVTINYQAPAEVDAGGDLLVCSDASEVSLSGSVSGGTSTGTWSSSGFGTFSPDATDLNGSYSLGNNDILLGFATLTLTSTNNGPCPASSDQLLLTINAAPTADAGSDIFVCSNAGSVNLSGNAQNALGSTWSSSGDGVFLPDNSDPNAEYIIGSADEQNESVTLTFTALGNQGCENASDQITVSINTPLGPAFSIGRACAGSPVQFTDETQIFSGSITGWNWDFGNGIGGSSQNPSVIYTESGNYTVELTVTSSLGCDETITQDIVVDSRPVAGFDISNNPAPIDFDIQFVSTSTNANGFTWYMGDGGVVIDEPIHSYSYDDGGLYTVSLVVTTPSGCRDSISRPLTIDGVVVLPPRLPNTFSPNGDGLNDVYYVRGGPFTNMDFRVYNGWGHEVFVSTQQEIGWDGTQDGKQLPLGVYVYTIKATTTEGESYEYTGKINLIR